MRISYNGIDMQELVVKYIESYIQSKNETNSDCRQLDI